MRIRTYNPYKSIVETPTTEELPEFTLISGANGVGKTHLLESMRENQTQFDGGFVSGQSRMLSAADLQVVEHLTRQPATREQKVSEFREQVLQQSAAFRGRPDQHGLMQSFLVQNRILTPAAISSMELAAGKSIEDWIASDFAKYTPHETGFRDLFTVMVGDAFFNYVYLHTLNGYKHWRSQEFGDESEWMEDGEFERLHGPPPWDVLNRVLADVGLDYRYEPPEPLLMPPYPAPRLLDLGSGYEVAPSELSSGEKTLLTIALSAYSVDNRRNAVDMPAVILLDEPDAALHPAMVRSLLNLVQREIVGKLGVPVLMTTHSPTTVALADEGAIHLMHRTGSPRLRKSSKDEALRTLLVGVPTLSVRAENRRTVVVESPNDERVYTRAAALLAPQIGSERSLQFMAAGSKELPNGCDAVVGLVSRLRENGNDQIWGLVDRDFRVAEPDNHVFFDSSRHSIENLVLDPLPLGLFLVRNGETRIVEDLDISSYIKIDQSRAIAIVTWLTAVLAREEDDRSPRSSTYATGLELEVESFWFETRGHELERRVSAAFPSLKAHQSHLLDRIIEFVWAEQPWAIPRPIERVFERLLNA